MPSRRLGCSRAPPARQAAPTSPISRAFLLTTPELTLTLTLTLTTQELLDRMYSLLIANNPELAGDRRKFLMKPPQVLPSAAAPPPCRAHVHSCCTWTNPYFKTLTLTPT